MSSSSDNPQKGGQPTFAERDNSEAVEALLKLLARLCSREHVLQSGVSETKLQKSETTGLD